MKKLVFVLLMMAALFACKKENEGGSASGGNASVIRINPQQLWFEHTGSDGQTVRVVTDGAWTVQAPEWVTVSPSSASGSATVTVTVSDNLGTKGRVGTVIFAPEIESNYNKLEVNQKADYKVDISTGDQFAQWLASLDSESMDEATITADLDMDGIELKSAVDFKGVLDGRDHSIKNLKSSCPLFRLNRGTLKNIIIDETCAFTPDTIVFGALVSRNEGTVLDCTNKADVTRTIDPGRKQSNLVAGLVGLSVSKTFTLSGCKNYGNISLKVKDDGVFTTNGVAGVVAYTLGNVSHCENYGDISLRGGFQDKRACPVRKPGDLDNIEVGEFYKQKVGSSVGGVVAYVIGTLGDCSNSGKVSWTETTVDQATDSPGRLFTGGVAGTYYGKVNDCVNDGELEIKVHTSNGQAFTGKNHQLAVGGVLGAMNNPSKDAPSDNRGVDITNCINRGIITWDVYSAASWTWLGGVVGWPNGEDRICRGTLRNCSNSGDITVTGLSRARFGGIAGMCPHMDGCSNTGNITISGSNKDSNVGGLAGVHNGTRQVLKNCTVQAIVTSAVAMNGISAGIGHIKNADQDEQQEGNVEPSCTWEGGSVNGTVRCDVTCPAVGLVVGASSPDASGDGSFTKVKIGTAAAAVTVSGSVNGENVTSGNAPTLLWGANYNTEYHSLNYVVQ